MKEMADLVVILTSGGMNRYTFYRTLKFYHNFKIKSSSSNNKIITDLLDSHRISEHVIITFCVQI